MKLGKYGGFITFNGKIYRAEEVINALLSQHTTEIKIFNDYLIIGNYQISPLRPTDEDIEQIMDMTCYGSLAYCCSLEKKCEIRDTVLHLLNITPEEYENIKRQSHKNFVFLAKQKVRNRVLSSGAFTDKKKDVISQQDIAQDTISQNMFEQNSFWKDINESVEVPFGTLEQDLFSTEENSYQHNQNVSTAKQNQIYNPRDINPVKRIQRYDNKEQKNVKVCKYCGASIPEYAKFCPACGRPITD